MKKYEITDIAHPDNPNLHRIRATQDLTEEILAGMLGGYVESYDNLDQTGLAWIEKDAIACKNAVVCGCHPHGSRRCKRLCLCWKKRRCDRRGNRAG